MEKKENIFKIRREARKAQRKSWKRTQSEKEQKKY
jgi:hypothetical protein